MLAEVCDETNQGLGMSLLTTSWGCGLVFGPVVGGFLSRPAEKYELFRDIVLFQTNPYLLPCIVGSIMAFLATTLAYFFLEETLGKRKGGAAFAMGDHEGIPEHSSPASSGDVEKGAEVDARNEAPSPPPKATFLGLMSDPLVRLSVWIYCSLSYAVVSFDELFPLWASTPYHLGGLAWNTNDIGLLMAMVGGALIFAQLYSFSILERAFGIVNLFRYCSLACAIVTVFMFVSFWG